MWLEMWASREILFQGDKVVEACNSICNQSKDQVNETLTLLRNSYQNMLLSHLGSFPFY